MPAREVRMLLRCVAGLVVLLVSSWTLGQSPRALVATSAMQDNLLPAAGWRAMNGKMAQGEAGQLVLRNAPQSAAGGGLVQVIQLNQKTPRAIVARGSAKSTNVSGSADSDYSLYLDIVYDDGSPLWGQNSPFPVGTHDWTPAEVTVMPARPIRQVSVYLLFRNHSGEAAFRDVGLYEPAASAGACFLDGQVVSVQGAPLSAPAIFLRDVKANSAFTPVVEGQALGVKVGTAVRPTGDGSAIDVTLADTTGQDRALTLIYAVPVGEGDWRWLPAFGKPLVAEAPQEYLITTHHGAGRGMMSRYPFAAVASGPAGRAITLDPMYPAFFRVGYAAGFRELYLAADIALTPERQSTARFSLATFDFDPKQGFRGALAGYYRLFPEYHKVRVSQQGLWMPFAPISKIESWEDFGFRVKEGNDETEWDDQHNILTFHYTEPMTWWMTMPKGTPRTLQAAEAHARKLAEAGNADAQALLTSGFKDDQGSFVGLLRSEPWCDGIVWSMNSAPGVKGLPSHYSTRWGEPVQTQLYGPSAKGQLDGEYIDSSEGYVTAELDYRRDHFAAMATPLTFAPATYKPAIFRGLITFEYVHGIEQDTRSRGKLMMANGTPLALPWLTPLLDVMGTETDWKPQNAWQPMGVDDLYYRRALCGGKPYCFLMNTDFTHFSHEDMERYMKRAMAFGMFPGCFSHNAADSAYFTQPALYNRDRDLFKRYLPVIRRLAEAGWQPVTRASADNEQMLLELFGESLFTVFNPTTQPQTVTIQLEAMPASATDLLNNRPLEIKSGRMTMTLAPEDVAVFEVAAR
jgi:hypothetical protein